MPQKLCYKWLEQFLEILPTKNKSQTNSTQTQNGTKNPTEDPTENQIVSLSHLKITPDNKNLNDIYHLPLLQISETEYEDNSEDDLELASISPPACLRNIPKNNFPKNNFPKNNFPKNNFPKNNFPENKFFIYNRSNLPLKGWFQSCYICSLSTGKYEILLYKKKTYYIYTCKTCSAALRSNSTTRKIYHISVVNLIDSINFYNEKNRQPRTFSAGTPFKLISFSQTQF